jgi:Protein of unknown function (DUF4089)
MNTDIDLARRALETAALSGIQISPEDLPAVVGVFSNLARVAAPLLDFPLPEKTAAAPVYTAFEVKPND